jgi:pyruvate/2-oxoglutarate dehydrogenase complex dihydrolipoamide dehydrogenase (E3) component
VRPPPPRTCYDLLIIGAGPAGLVAAHEAVSIGARVALIERQHLGGSNLNYGCIPSKSLLRTSRLYAEMRHGANFGAVSPSPITVDWSDAMLRLRRIRIRIGRTHSAETLSREGIALFFGNARFIARDAVDVNGQALRFRKALIATGSRPSLPDIPGLEETGFLTNETVFDLPTMPKSLLVIGGGPLGCELAQAFARLGVHTVIAHSEPLFLPTEERDAAQMVSDSLARDGVDIHLNSRAVRARAEGGQKSVDLVRDGISTTTTVEQILTGIGRTPAIQGLGLDAAGVTYDTQSGVHVDDFLRTRNPRIYAAGDVCLEQRYTNTATASARIVVRNALRRGHERLSALTVPWCTYTDPEIAHVGLYVREASERKIPVKTFTIPMHDVHRAIADSEDIGFVKIHIREGTDRILGATIVARNAGEMINTVSLAIAEGIGLGTLAEVIHAYPTKGSAIRQAADAYVRTRRRSRIVDWWRRAWPRGSHWTG